MRVPAALRIARGIETLAVGIDPASCAETTVSVDPAMVLGIESTTRLFSKGRTRLLSQRHGDASGSDFAAVAVTWNAQRDGIPEPGKNYVIEMHLVLFETDVRPGPRWNPHRGRFKTLLSRTIRQAEE